MPGGPPGVQTGMAGTPFAPPGGAPPGAAAHVALGVSDLHGAVAQRGAAGDAEAGFSSSSTTWSDAVLGYGAMPSSGAAPLSGGISGPVGPPGAEVTSAGGNAWQAGGGHPAAGAETKDT